jgi:hypothetical protein
MPASVKEMGYTEDRTLEGWAFAGINMKHMPSVLNRMLDLIEDGLIADKDWIHFLGIGRLKWACYLTSIKRQLQKHHNPNINVSFDAASPFVAAGGYALSYNYNYFTPQKLTYSMGKSVDDKNLKGSTKEMPHQGPIMERLVAGDICYLGHNDANKIGKVGKTSWDTMSYLLIMAHNVYNHIQAVQETLRLADIEYARNPDVSYKDAVGYGKKAPNLSEFIPNDILYFNNFVEVLFDPATSIADARQMIVDNTTFLNSISFGGVEAARKAKSKDIFDTAEEVPDEEDMASLDDANLTALEQELDNDN